MLVTQKKQYALRAIFELARREGEHPIKSSVLAQSQAIPLRFLEVIMGQLKRAGLVVSKRGAAGGYLLAKQPNQLYVGEIFRALDREDNAQTCVSCTSKRNCPFLGDCVFMELWEKAQTAVDDVYDRTTIQTLLEAEKR